MKMFTKFFAAIAVILALGAASAQAATYNVTNNNDLGPGSLRQAIIDANANVGVADLILIDGPVSGTITTLASDLPDITESCTISCPNATFTVDGQDLYNVFYVNAGGAGNVVINGINVVDAGDPADNGPGLYITNGSVTVTSCTFSSCTGTDGGGVMQLAGSSTFINTYIDGCSASANGGGFHISSGSASFYRCIIQNNTSSGDGGGIYLSPGAPTIVVEQCSLNQNTAQGQHGGGIYQANGVLILEQTSVDGNTANEAGGIYISNGSGTINRSTISNNFAAKTTNQAGGGFYIVNTSAAYYFTNSTIAGNWTEGDAGAIYMADGNIVMTYCTVTDNTCDLSGSVGDGGGLDMDAGTFNMMNTIFSGNIDNSGGGGMPSDISVDGGTFNDNGGNLCDNDIDGVIISANSVVGEQPYLNALAYNDGGNGNVTQTRSVQECSAARRLAVALTGVHALGITIDQNGMTRDAIPNQTSGAVRRFDGLCPTNSADNDGDGIPDDHEADAPNFGDANSDGVIDSREGYVCTFMNDAGTGYLIIESSTLTDGSDSYTVYKPFNTHFSGMEATMFPVGLTGARLEGAPGFSKVIRYWFYTDLDPNLIAGYKWYIKTAPDYAKYEWHEVPPDNGNYGYIANSLTYGTTDGQNWIRFDVRYTDNMFGDSNPIAGILDDPIAPYTAMTSIPALGEWGGYALGGVLTLAGAFIILRRKFL